MADKVSEVMTRDPATCNADDTAVDAGKAMRDGDFGAVIVTQGDSVHGILTDRDIVVRAVAEGRDPSSTRIGDICTANPTTLSADDDIDAAIARIREEDVRRLPVVDEGGTPVGIVSLGDLAVERDEDSALADISAASPNN
ncbi:MAG TPA: CBS domain-containing protein [Solirubrobacterales bacterium]|nr:CBS domain-containing protein [Solirubrobacterales bacterium]